MQEEMEGSTLRDTIVDQLMLEIESVVSTPADPPVGINNGVSTTDSSAEPAIPAGPVAKPRPGPAAKPGPGPAAKPGPADVAKNQGEHGHPAGDAPHWRSRGRRASVNSRQKQRFIAFLYKLSDPHYYWGPRRGRGRGNQ